MCHRRTLSGPLAARQPDQLNLAYSAANVAREHNRLRRTMSETPVNEMSFEEAMKELEQVVGQLE
ncbi:MAG: hypothetical protein AAFV74_20525, partial [Pseudomonadota bacterium]